MRCSQKLFILKKLSDYGKIMGLQKCNVIKIKLVKRKTCIDVITCNQRNHVSLQSLNRKYNPKFYEFNIKQYLKNYCKKIFQDPSFPLHSFSYSK